MKFSLRLKLLLMTGFVLSLSMLSALYLTLKFNDRVEISTERELQLKSFSLGESIAAQFYERYGDVQAFAANEIMQIGDSQSISSALNTYIPMYGIYDLIIVTDMKGNYVASNNIDTNGKPIPNAQVLKGRNFSNEAWFKSAVAGQFTDDKEKALSGTLVEPPQFDPIVSEVYGTDRYVNGFTTLIKNKSGTPIGVITNRANFKWVEFETTNYFKNLKAQGYSSARLSVVGPEGQFLVDYWPKMAKTEDLVHKKDFLGKEKVATQTFTFTKGSDESSGSYIWKDPVDGLKRVSGMNEIVSTKFPQALGWKTVITIDSEELFGEINKNLNFVLLSFLAIFLIGSAVSFFFSKTLATKLQTIANSLSQGSQETAQAAHSIADSSNNLSTSSTEQSASLQQTVTAVDQITAMVSKTAESAAQSQKSARESQDAIQTGQKAVKEMIHSMDGIKRSNSNIVEQIQRNAQEMDQIVRVISEIGGKTKVINDIVFQTKLLSFNASVEAARAGEHGKGFAVVAEEVGNLAQMSGSASKEISSMLDSSIQKVNLIASSTKENVEKLFQEINSTLKQADQNAHNCEKAFEKVMSEAEKVFDFLSEISTATTEQNTGIQEINKMMNQLDAVTQRTNSASQKTASAAEELSAQSDGLKQLAFDLKSLIVPGGTADHPSVTHEKPKENVYQFQPKAPVKPTSSQSELKTAIGSPAELPASDDSRFEDL